MTTLSERIRALRLAHNWNLAEAAEAAGIASAQWHALEGGRQNPTLMTMWRIATGLGISMTELTTGVTLEGEDAPSPAAALGARIRARRNLLGLSQATAAQLAGVTRNEWSDMERGARTNPTWTRIQQVARALDLHPGELLHNVAPPDGEAEADSDDD